MASQGLLSCSATAGMTLQLPCVLHTCTNFGDLLVASHLRVQPRVSASLHNLEHFFTLSHSLPLHDSHLNTGLLIAKIQANLARNKANKMVDKIQPYTTKIPQSQISPHDLNLRTRPQSMQQILNVNFASFTCWIRDNGSLHQRLFRQYGITSCPP